MRTWVLQRWQTYARLSLLTALFLSPVIFTRVTVDVFNLTKITSLWIFGILALAGWVVLSSERGVWVPRLRLFWFAGAFLLAVLLSTLLSQDTGLSLIGLYHRYGGLIPFLLYAMIALLIVGLYWERPDDLKEVPRATTLASAMLAGYVLIQQIGWDWIPWRDSNGQPPAFPVGTMGNSNFAGGYLAIAAPLFLFVVVSTKDRTWRIILAGAFALDLLALWYTQTRGALIAVGVSAAAIAFLYRDRLPRWLRLTTLVGVVGALLLGVVVLFHPGMQQAPGLFSKAGQFSPFRTGTFQDRSYYWITALRIFKHHPVLGTGPDTYYANYPIFRLAKDGAKLGLTITDKPHNIFLEYASNTGILGLGSYLTLMGAALWFGYRRVQQLEGTARMLLVAFMGTLVAYMTNQFFSIDVPPLAVMGWVALAGIAVLADPGAVAARAVIEAARARKAPNRGQQKKKKAAARTPPPYGGIRVVRTGRTNWLAHSITGVLALVLVYVGIRPFLADHLAHNGQIAQASQASPASVVAIFRHAFDFQSLEPSYLSLAGSVYESLAGTSTDPATRAQDFSLALPQFQEALRLQPESVFNMMSVARIYTNWGTADPTKFPLADRWWQKAVAQDPTDWQVRDNYALMLSAWADSAPTDTNVRNREITAFEAVVKIRPDQSGAWGSLAKAYTAVGRTTQAKQAATTALSLDKNNTDAKAILASSTATASPTTGG